MVRYRYSPSLVQEKKLAKHIREWQDKGYAFTYKVFPNMGHGTLAGEHPELFSKEVQAALFGAMTERNTEK